MGPYRMTIASLISTDELAPASEEKSRKSKKRRGVASERERAKLVDNAVHCTGLG